MIATAAKRALALVGVIVLGLGTLALAGGPASANTESTVKISVGQTVKLTLNDLAGDDASGAADYEVGATASPATPTGQNAAGCDGPSNPSCDDIPITLQVPKAELAPNNNLFLQTVFTYNTGPQVTAPNGTFQYTNSVNGWIWENPIPTTGPNANTYDESCFNEPCEEGVASPTVANFDLIIDQQTGNAGPVAVTISLFDVSSGAGNSGGTGESGSGGSSASSGSSGAGPNSAPSGGAGSTSTATGAFPSSASSSQSSGSLASPPTTTPRFALDTAGADPLLASLANTDFASELGIGAGKALRAGQFLGAPTARPASGMAVTLSLTVGPLLLVGLLGLMAFRRRGATI